MSMFAVGPLVAENAMRRPSGDHAASDEASDDGVSVRAFAPPMPATAIAPPRAEYAV
jgi:hypothetical protein